MSSLGCLGLLYITDKWIGIHGTFILKNQNMRHLSVKHSLETCSVEFMITHVMRLKRNMKIDACRTFNKEKTYVVCENPSVASHCL